LLEVQVVHADGVADAIYARFGTPPATTRSEYYDDIPF